MLNFLFMGLDVYLISLLINSNLKDKKLNSYELMLGYKGLLFHAPIVINMKKTPHVFISGLSGSGKSRMAEFCLKDKNVILINCFEEDFQSLSSDHVNGNENILLFLQNLLKNLYYYKEPFYILIDEVLTLCLDKKISNYIMQLLTVGRHYNIFLIVISQDGTKENVKFKNLFNVRVSFRQVEESSYRVVLGYSPEDTKLNKREFYIYSDTISKGKTYNI